MVVSASDARKLAGLKALITTHLSRGPISGQNAYSFVNTLLPFLRYIPGFFPPLAHSILELSFHPQVLLTQLSKHHTFHVRDRTEYITAQKESLVFD